MREEKAMAAGGGMTMPCVWDCDTFADGTAVQINTFHWTYLGVPNKDWSQPVLHNKDVPDSHNLLLIVRADAAAGSSFMHRAARALWGGSDDAESFQVAFRGPNGKLLAAHADATVTASGEASGTDIPTECMFRVEKKPNKKFTIWSVSNSYYLRAWDNGTLRLHMKAPTSWELFSIRTVSTVPKFVGVNLGGWLVAESWMCPKHLFDGVHKDLLDGTKVSLSSLSEGRWVCAEGGGGDQLNANRGSPSGWENFFFRRTPNGSLQIRAGSGHYWSVGHSSGELLANRMEGGQRETFGIRRQMGKDNKIQLRACNGKWVRVAVGGKLYADVEEDAPGWSSSCTFEMKVEANMGGEYQLHAGLGPEESRRRVSAHRSEWVTETDFQWLAARGVNAVRVPVGYWIAEGSHPEPPFIEGTLECLDQAFAWAHSHGLRVVVCLHAAPGSQNGWEHSASRDGVAEWTRHVGRTVQVIDFLVARYGGHANFSGLEPINEPTVSGISFDDLAQYYKDCYNILRQRSPTAYFIIGSRIFASEREWDNFMIGPEHTNVVFDAHWYQVHDTNTFGGKSVEFNLKYPRKQRRDALKQLERGTRLVFIGEWSLALNCKTDDNIYSEFAQAQVETYLSSSAGFFFWSFKHGQGWDPWTFQRSVEKGWLNPRWWSAGLT